MSHKAEEIYRTVIPLGPYHPLQEEAEFFQLTVEGETVVDIDMRTSYNHRGIEKISETLTWDQVPFLVERVCGICSCSHPFAYVNAVEDLCGAQVPERAKYIRTIVAELERLHSHMLWVGLAGHFLGYNTVFMWAWRYREPILDIMEKITGNRQNYAMLRPGGARRDIKNENIPEILKAVNELEPIVDMLTKAVLDDPVLIARLKGVGILTKEDAVKYCVTGPTARGSGVKIDVRRDEPYGVYDLLDWKVITQESGDVLAKAVVRLLELFESIKIIRQCLQKMEKTKEGEIFTPIKEFPVGEGIGHAEAPRGEVYHYVRSDGGNRPVRHKIRAPSFVNVPSFKASCIGYTISDVTITLAAVDPCYSCTERLAVIDRKSNKKILNGHDLIHLSQQKTELLKKKMGINIEKGM